MEHGARSSPRFRLGERYPPAWMPYGQEAGSERRVRPKADMEFGEQQEDEGGALRVVSSEKETEARIWPLTC